MLQAADVLVAGGGPAGCSAAVQLAGAGYRVLLLERSGYGDWRAGETLPPAVSIPLAELGVWERFCQDGHVASHAIHSAWGSSELYEKDLIYNPYGNGWHVDRAHFDRMLAARAREIGVKVLEGAQITAAARTGSGWRVALDTADLPACEAHFLVDATGRGAGVAGLLGARRVVHDQLVGLVGILTGASAPVETPAILLLEAAAEGWWYSVPLPDGSLLAAYMTDPDILSLRGLSREDFWRAQLDGSTHTRERSRGLSLSENLRVRAAGSVRLDSPAGDGWIAIGDAAGVYDPLSAAGIHKALHQGLDAAKAIAQFLDGNESAIAHQAEVFVSAYNAYLVSKQYYYRREMRWPDSPFWRRRHIGQDGSTSHAH